MTRREEDHFLAADYYPLVETLYITVDPEQSQEIMDARLATAVDYLRASKLVAIPTETVYGLAANALDEMAVKRIFLAKGRPQDNPMIVHVDSAAAIRPLVSAWPVLAEKLVERFMPGPLTLIFPKSDLVSTTVSGGLDTIGIRIPSHPVALRILELSALPLAAPSANRSGRPSPTEAAHVAMDLDSRIDCIVDAGSTDVGLESTVLDLTPVRGPRILRPGAVTLEALASFFIEHREEAWPFADEDWLSYLAAGHESSDTSQIVARSPGMKYRHYAPKARVCVLRAEDIASVLSELSTEVRAHSALFISQELAETLELDDYGATHCFGPRHRADLAGHDLFAAFRIFDKKGCEVIFAEALDEEGLGRAYMNRLNKSASAYTEAGGEEDA